MQQVFENSKSAKEKAEYWLDDNVAGWTETQLKTLTVLLKEQDRDTRHACAKAIMQCNSDGCGEVICKDEAHSACMNVKAV